MKVAMAAGTLAGQEKPGFTPPSIGELAWKFPQLEIIELIGRGGMGAVYKARQKELDRIVALKILPPGIGDDAAFAERFAREARALARLNHPGIITIHDFGRADGLYFFIMEFVDGVNLRQLLDSGRVSPREALAIVPQICDALQFAHDQGIVHRDIKPGNILLDRHGRVKVADFGLAKLVGMDALTPSLSHPMEEGGTPVPGEGAPASGLTVAGKVMGTPAYMAPEQFKHPADVDHRADIYALGVVFYQMLTGELPGKAIEPPSRKVQIDVRLDEVVLRALEKKPELRYQQVSKVKTMVETIAATPRASNESAAKPDSLTKVSLCYVSTPEYLRTFRGRFLWIYKGKGELCLDRETLSFHSGWPKVTIPLSSIRTLALGDYPMSAKPWPLHYMAVTFTENNVSRTLLFTPVRSWVMSPWEANKVVAEWLSALQEAIRACTGRTLSVDQSDAAQNLSWWDLAKTFFLSAAGLTVIFAVIPLILWHRLPNGLGELWPGPVLAAVSMALFLIVGSWRRRSTAKAYGEDGKSSPIAPQPSTQNRNTQNMNANTHKSFWLGTVISVIVVACLAGAGLAILLSNKPKPIQGIPQDWSVMHGVSEQWDWTNNAITGHTTNGDCILASTKQYGDVTVSAIVSTTNREASLAIRLQDAENGYIAAWVPDGTPAARGDCSKISLLKRTSGEERELGLFVRRGLAQSAKLTVSASGPKIEVRLNDVTILKARDSTFASGFIGLRVYGDPKIPCDGTFSNVTFY
jgi:serine/threonine protein kinase